MKSISRSKWQRSLFIALALVTVLSLVLSACAMPNLSGTGGGGNGGNGGNGEDANGDVDDDSFEF